MRQLNGKQETAQRASLSHKTAQCNLLDVCQVLEAWEHLAEMHGIIWSPFEPLEVKSVDLHNAGEEDGVGAEGTLSMDQMLTDPEEAAANGGQ